MIRIVKANQRVVIALSKISRMSMKRVNEHLKYNIITIKQLSILTKQTVYAIENAIRLNKLTVVRPFPTGRTKGPRFIARDEKFDIYLRNFVAKHD